MARRAAVQLLRLVPGAKALRLKRDLRDAEWLCDADAIIISYPKSGRTFIRAMLARLYQRRFAIDERELLDFETLRRSPSFVPRLLFTHAGDAMRRPSEIDPDLAAFSGSKVVLVARHPADVAISRYHHLRERSRNRARRRLAQQPLEAFIWAEEGGIPSIVTFLNRFVAMPGLFIIRYEDVLGEPRFSLERLANAIGLEVDEADILDAVDFASLPKLREREREGYFTSSRLRIARAGDGQSAKVRRGTSGAYRVLLDPRSVARIDSYVETHLDRRFGYDAPESL